MEDVRAYLALLILFKEASGARRHWPRGKWWHPMLIVQAIWYQYRKKQVPSGVG
jgi:hypothetical protein